MNEELYIAFNIGGKNNPYSFCKKKKKKKRQGLQLQFQKDAYRISFLIFLDRQSHDLKQVGDHGNTHLQ